jgi:hypothetical protein
MTEVDAMEFYKRVAESDRSEAEYTIEHESNAQVTVTLTVVDRKTLLDEIARLPDEMLDMLTEADDEDEAKELAEEQNMLTGVNGDTILAFENICAESIQHEEWTSHNVEDIVRELAFEVLFEIGSKVIEMSFEESGSIKDFHEVESGKSS